VKRVTGCVGIAALLSYRFVSPVAEELVVMQRGPSNALYVEEAPREYAGEFKQHRGNRRDAHIFPALNMGSLNCVVGIPVPESGRLRADLAQEEYPADPALADVRRVSWSPNSIVLDVQAKAPTTIYVNQNWHRKWRASVGVIRNEDGLLAVDVPAGKMTLQLDYRDNILWVAFFISAGTLLTIAYFGGRQLVRGARREWARFGTLPVFPGQLATDGPATTEAQPKSEKAASEKATEKSDRPERGDENEPREPAAAGATKTPDEPAEDA
jgi:hypothetical protein